MLVNDLLDLLRQNEIVGNPSLLGSDDIYKHVIGAESAATGLDNVATLADNGIDALFIDDPDKLGFYLLGAGRYAAGSLTDQNFDSFAHNFYYPLWSVWGSTSSAAGCIQR